MAGSDNESDDASVHSEATIPQQQRNIQPQIITTVLNNNAKFPYLKKNEYERTGRDRDGRVIILPPTTADEHIAVQRESKARTTLLQSIPDDHVADFHYMDDARDIWNAVKARFGGNAESKKMRKSMLKQEFSEFRISEAEGLHKGYDRMHKILSPLNQLKAKPEDEDINLKFLRALPSSWSQVALTLKTKGPNHSAFVSTTSASKKMSYADSPSYSSSTYTVPSNSKTGSQRSGNVIEDVLQSFVADTEPEQQLAYEDFDQIEKLDLEEMDLKWQMAMLSVRVHKFEQKAGRKIDFDKKESARFNKKKVRCYKCLQRGHFARECRAKGGNDKQRYSSFKIQEIGKKEEDSKALITVDTLVDWTEHDGQSDGVIAPKEFGMIAGYDTEDAIEEGAAKIYNLITGADTKEASTAGDAGEFALMGVTSETAKKELQTKLDNHLVQIEKWRSSSKNLFRLIDSSMFVRTKVGLGFNNYIRENELGWDDSAFSVFTTNSEEVEDGQPIDLPPVIYSVKSSEPKSKDSTSCASTSSDLPSFSYNSSDKNENTSRTSCNKNGYFNKKAGHFRKNASSVSKLCFVCGSSTHLIKDCDFYEKQMANKTVGNGVGPVHSRNNMPFPVPTDRGYSPSATSGWWKSTARPMPHLNRPTSSYFQTYTPYVPQMYYNHMKYGGVRWATAVKPSAGCSWKTHRKGLYWENPYSDAEDEGIFDSGCSRSMTGRITGKGTIRTPTLDFENVYYVKELQQFNLFSISQICDKKNRVLYFKFGKQLKKIFNDVIMPGQTRIKSTTGGCQFLGKRLISWQCKNQIIMATSSTEAEYVVAANCCGQKLIQVLKIHTDDNVADLLTKAFDGPRVFNSPMLHLLRVEMVINSPWIMPLLGTKGLASPEQTATGVFGETELLIHQGDVMIPPKSVAGSRFPEGSSMLLTFDVQMLASSEDIQLICENFQVIKSKTQADWMLLYVVPTGSVVVPTGGQ
ncbi:ribonuclease H-like domain-containing protein [Tanacetum coccineum]